MRIRRTDPALRRSSPSRAGSASPRARAFLPLALGLLLIVAVSLAVWLNQGGGTVIRTLARRWLSPQAARQNGLPTLQVEIELAAYRRLTRQRRHLLQTGFLPSGEEQWIEAQAGFDGRRIPIRVRLYMEGGEGAYLPQDGGQDQWPLEVDLAAAETLGDPPILGMRSFALLPPASRGYLDGWLYAQDLRDRDILAPRRALLNVEVNGDDWGVYLAEEALSRAALASQGRGPGVVVRMDEGLLGEWDATTGELPGLADLVALDTTPDRDGSVPSLEAVAALDLLRQFLRGEVTADQAFDAVQTGRYLAHAHLWGARVPAGDEHPLYYYDLATSRLEPIGQSELPFAAEALPTPGLGVYEAPAIMAAYAEEVERISEAGFLSALQRAHGEELERYRTALARETYLAYLEPPWDRLVDRQALLHAVLHPPQAVHARASAAWNVIHDRGAEPGAIELAVGNLSRYPVVLEGVRLGDRAMAVQPEWIVEGRGLAQASDLPLLLGMLPAVVLRGMVGDVPDYLTLRVPAEGPLAAAPPGNAVYSTTMQVETRLVGVGDALWTEVLPEGPPGLPEGLTVHWPTVQEALARHPFLAQTDRPGFLELKPGSWHVQGDLVLPRGLGLWGGGATTLTFDPGAALLAAGSLVLDGPEGEGIRLLPAQDHWAGLVVWDTGPGRRSWLRHVEIRATTGVHLGGWTTRGGVTFDGNPVTVRDSRLLDSYAQDTLHILRSEFELVGVELGNGFGDGLNGDLVQGRIERSTFHDLSGDAVDLSGSHVFLQDVRLRRVHDHGVSANEGSAVTIQGLQAEDVGVAVASRDASSARVRDAWVKQAWQAGFAAYLERLAYGPARVEVLEAVFADGSTPALADTGCTVTIDGTLVPARDLDPAALYRQWEAPPPMRALNVRLGPAIWLVGYELLTPEVSPGGAVELTLYWRALASVKRQYTVFVHVRDDAGENVAGWDTMPRRNTFPTTDWPVRELIDDGHRVPLPGDLPPGEYRVALGMYYWGTGERLPAYTAEGQPIAEDAIVLEQVVRVQ